MPIHKGGSKSSPSIYHPIALLSIVSNVAEKTVHCHLSNFLQPVLTSKQSGFKKKDSTNMQLTRQVQDWSTALDDSNFVGVVFFDIKKAFDRVCLPALLLKLRSVGICGKALSWFESFLCNRSQRTSVGQHISPPADLYAGVPQGPILSSTLFPLYMNDIVHSMTANVNLFADDTSIYVTDKTIHGLHHKLQAAVDELAAWFFILGSVN